MIQQLMVVLVMVMVVHATVANEFVDKASVDSHLVENRYIHEINQYSDFINGARFKRAAPYNIAYNVTQCSYDNTEPIEGPHINVMGKNLQDEDSTLKAAKLIHLMVRFMPRPLFTRLANNSAVGLFSTQSFPSREFTEFLNEMPPTCLSAGCSAITLGDGTNYECSQWCTTSEYPFYPSVTPINLLWAYGNFSTTFVVETNVGCFGYNPSLGENLLIREYGLAIMSRALDESTRSDITAAFTNAASNGTWDDLKNEYDYFVRGTQAWFNGASDKVNLGGMACLNMRDQQGMFMCEDSFQQRQFIKQKDPNLYKILNFVYNNNREYLNSDTSTCSW